MSETFTPDNLIAGQTPIVGEGAILLSGQNVTRGTLLGKITTGGKLKLSASASIDGSEVPYAIAAADTNATSGDTNIPIYLAGEFNANAITFGTGHTLASTKAALRDKGIFLRTVQEV